MAREIKENVQVRSNLDSTLVHNGIEIEAREIVSVDSKVAEELINKGFCTLIKVKAV